MSGESSFAMLRTSSRITRTISASCLISLGVAMACVGGGASSESSMDADAGTDTQTGDGDADASGDGDGDQACTPELEVLRAEIFAPSCALGGCHASADAAGGLDLETADLEAELVGAPSGTCDGWVRVVPGSPDESLLYTKLGAPAPCGTVMPPTGELPAAQLECVRTWIENLEGISCETCGGDACVDLQTDAQHCGTCDNACPAGVTCSAGSCVCPDGQDLCDGACIDTQSDPQNCGGCGSPCAPDEVCWMGVCADTCAELTDCDGACVDTQTDSANCGSCGNACDGGSACVMGGCDCAGDGVSFTAEVEPVLVDGCAGVGCHGFPVSAAGLDLRLGQAYANLVGVPSTQCDDRLLVAPGQPGASYLMDKLQGINLCFGTQMPKADQPLSASDLAAISEWICRGAMDN
jgi:hypothetical protein